MYVLFITIIIFVLLSFVAVPLILYIYRIQCTILSVIKLHIIPTKLMPITDDGKGKV